MQKLQLLSLNIGHGMLANDALAYIQRKKETVSVFCLQEVSGKILDDLNALLANDFVGYYAEKETDQENVYYGLVTFVDRHLLVLESQPILQHINGPGLALRCTIQGALTQTITVTNVHGVPQPGHKLDTADRITQSEAILQHVAHTGASSSIIMGDFNLSPDTQSVKMFERHGYRNLIDEYTIPTTRNEIAWNKYPAHMKQLYADYAFIRVDGVIDYDFIVENNTVSDHLPLQLTLTAVQPAPSTAAERERTSVQQLQVANGTTESAPA